MSSQAVLIPEGYRQCERKRGGNGCKHLYRIEPGRVSKACDMCRATSNRNANSVKGVENRRKSKENGNVKKWDRNTRDKNGEKIRARQAAFGRGPKGREIKKRYRASPKGVEARKRYDNSIMGKLGTSLGSMIRGKHLKPTTFKRLGIFDSNDDARRHFESTFDTTWMNWTNHGFYSSGAPYRSVWQIGHRIPKCWYDHEDESEIKKAWSRKNLFAQCGRQNVEAGNTMILSESEWLALKSVWPKECVSMTDEDAWQWAKSKKV